jgi:hypothetical protein
MNDMMIERSAQKNVLLKIHGMKVLKGANASLPFSQLYIEFDCLQLEDKESD